MGGTPASSPLNPTLHIIRLTGRGLVEFNEEKHRKTPLIFAPEQQLSLREDENVGGYNPFRAPFLAPVGLLLDKDEAMDVVTLITKQMQSRPSLTKDLKEGPVLFSGGVTDPTYQSHVMMRGVKTGSLDNRLR